MLFHTVEFFWFMLFFVVLVLAMPRSFTLLLLLFGSYLFYGWSGPLFFTLLLMFSSITDYSLARYFGPRPELWKKGILVSALVNFSILGYFKYSNFVFSNLNPAFAALGLPAQLPMLDIALPVGISFYTFQSFAYTVDVLTGRIPACRSLPRFLLFVTWFPQLVAGPILRAGDLLPQIDNIESKLSGMARRVPAAATLFAEGWLRKAFADLVSPTSDVFFRDPTGATGAGALFGIIAFGLQIYGDFSGYTKMAQGASWLFGVRLMENFNLPYVATSVRDFWRRWHLSLSTWFRDYLYVPLGGNRGGAARTYFNLALTMLVCGMWHGANWTFLLWGALHGALMIIERILTGRSAGLPIVISRPLTLAFVFLAWVPFRAPDIATTWKAYAALGNGGWEWPALGFVLGLLGLIAIDRYYHSSGRDSYATVADEGLAARTYGEWRAAMMVAACALVWSAAHVLGQNKVASFIYFQF